MSELPNYPFIDQLNSTTSDGQADENSHMNCVPSCIASGLDYLLNDNYNPDEIKDAVYGQGYTGGMAAVEYVSFCAARGVHLYPINGNTTYLVSQIHEHLALGHPVLGTIQSSYLPADDPMNPGPSHCIAFYKDETGVLVAMNPWNAFAHVGTDQYWVDRLCFGQVWVMEKVSQTKVQVPQGWNIVNNVLVAPNKNTVKLGFMQYVLAHNWHPDDYPLEDEHSNGHGTTQLFRSRRLTWSPNGGVTESYLGDELLTAVAAAHTIPPDVAQAINLALSALQKVVM